MAERGFTLPELLVTLAIAAAAMAIAVPAFNDLLAANRATAALNQIVGAISVARTEAILQRRTVTLCPGADGICQGRDQWHHGALVFIDADRNGRIDEGERVVATLPPLQPGERIYWRSFRNRSYLQFHPRGFTDWQNGNFLYCPRDGQPRHARMVILNAQGRVRVARDADGDGVAEDADDAALRCP
jgi:type IV fimbrial biogenesis protein FimT